MDTTLRESLHDGPTEVVCSSLRLSASGGMRTHRICFSTAEKARHYAARWPLPDDWTYEPCPHLPDGA